MTNVDFQWVWGCLPEGIDPTTQGRGQPSCAPAVEGLGSAWGWLEICSQWNGGLEWENQRNDW